MNMSTDTIVAIATPLGRGGIGVVRVSGSNTKQIAKLITSKDLIPRLATFSCFKNSAKQTIDEGIAIYFPAPHSFTGEDVVEFQGHGGPVVLDQILQAILKFGARLAKPGEFSLRAFLNNKFDLVKAEAIADLIDASSEQAARSAVRSLQGEFSKRIKKLVDDIIHLRIMVEASIDFPEEEIDFLADPDVTLRLKNIIKAVESVQQAAKQGTLLRDGITVVIAGKPNAGKSSLLNCLVGRDAAIVTDIPGTTRDVLKEYIQLDGMPLHIIDTAGLRESTDLVEQEGIKRAKAEIEKADLILLVVDDNDTEEMLKTPNPNIPTVIIKNKIDITERKPSIQEQEGNVIISLSVKQQQGIYLLEKYLKQFMGFESPQEDTFIARRRHLDAIEKTQHHLINGLTQLNVHKAGELLAEDLRQAQQSLSEITGEFTADDLLGRIFSSFCIGK